MIKLNRHTLWHSSLFILALLLIILGSTQRSDAGPSQDTSHSAVQALEKSNSELDWYNFDQHAFATARKEGRFLILDLKAVWCHWCHVMAATTYRAPAVVALINDYYIPIQVDHDARPDLAERYRDWGWPATIIFAPDGSEIVKRAGYIDPEDMARLLQAVVDDPSPESGQLRYPTQVATSPALPKALRKELEERHQDTFDKILGGLNIPQKFIERDSLNWDLTLAASGDQGAAERARLTLNGALALIDPAFGGAYQYSTQGDWHHPHYEKIMRVQAGYIRAYSRGYQILKDPRYLEAAEHIAQYLNEFLSAPDGGFYSSQDADLKQGQKAHDYFRLDREQRLALGIPRIDTKQYASVAGDAADALLALYAVSEREAYLSRAESAIRWGLQHRRLGNGGFRHDHIDFAGPYLPDTLNMGHAFLRYAQLRSDPKALDAASSAADFIGRYFRHPTAGLISATDNGTPVAPLPQIDQNIRAAAFLLTLYEATGESRHLALAEHILRYLNSPAIVRARITEAGLLSLDRVYRRLLRNPPMPQQESSK